MSLRLAIACALVASLVGCKQEECLAGSVACDGTCVRLATDGAHCGTCGNACAPGSVCSNGACAATCAAPLATCGTGAAAFCTNLASDPANCGACGAPCATGLVCDGGRCDVTCTDAGSFLCDGRCVDTATDVANCGGCGAACAPGTTCVASACTPTCPTGQVRCGDRCVDLASDPLDCGACGEVCPDYGVCAAGTCSAVTCRGGFGLPGVPDVVGPLTYTLAPVDADRDGRVDLLVGPAVSVDTPTSTVQLLRNLGGRRFVPAPPLPAGLPVERVGTGDVDGDGIFDLVAGGGGDVTILRGTAAGGFLAATPPFEMSTLGFTDLAIADVSGDGRADVITASFYVSVRLGTVGGGLGAKADYGATAAPFNATSVAVGDVDGDGLPDIVAGQHQDGHFAVYLNLGGGVFAEPVVYFDYRAPVLRLALGDVDGDGDLDVLGAGDGLVVLLNAGDGTLGAPILYPTGDGDSLAVADFDGDGDLDAAVGDFGVPRRIDLFRNSGNGTFLAPEPYYDAGPWELAAADLDGDGRVDLAAAASVGAGVHLLWNDGAGFAQPGRSPSPVAPYGVALGDVDGDGRADAVVADHTTSDAALLLGDGRGAFLPGLAFEGADVMMGDLDGDGDDDLIVYATSVGGDPVLRSLRLEAGVLVQVQELPAVGSPGLSQAALGDLDGDGVLDLVGLANLPAERQVVWLRGVGDGTFSAAAPVGALDAWGATALALGDLDGNGWTDVVALGGDASLLVWRNTGSGAFLSSVEPIPGIDFSSYVLALGDLDGDGVLDVAYAHETLSTNAGVGVLLGRGEGSFEPLSPLPSEPALQLAVGSPGGRQRNVLFVADDHYAGAGDVVEVDASGKLARVGRWTAPNVIGPLRVRDVDGDLRPDLVMGTVGGLTVRLAKCLP
jgi:hypothetical protein